MAKIRRIDPFDPNDPGVTMEDIFAVFPPPSGHSQYSSSGISNYRLTDLYRGGGIVPTVESATIPTSGQITILDFQSAGEGLPQGFANRHWGVVCTGESPVPVSNSGKSFTVTPPSTMDGKHFGMILIGAGGGASGNPGNGGAGGGSVYIPKGVKYTAGEVWTVIVGSGGLAKEVSSGNTASGFSGGSTIFKVDGVTLVTAGGGAGGGTSNTAIKPAGGTSSRSSNSNFNNANYPNTGQMVFGIGGDGGKRSPSSSGNTQLGGGGGGVGGFSAANFTAASASGSKPTGGDGWGLGDNANGTGGTGFISSAGGGGRGTSLGHSTPTSTLQARNCGGGIFDSAYDKGTASVMDNLSTSDFLSGVDIGFHDAVGVPPVAHVASDLTGINARQKNFFIGTNNTSNDPRFDFKLTATNKDDTNKLGGLSSKGGRGTYGGKDGGMQHRGASSSSLTPGNGTVREYAPSNWGGGGGANSTLTDASDTARNGCGNCGGPGIFVMFGVTPSAGASNLTADGGEIQLPHIFPSMNGWFEPDGWH